MSQYFGIPTLRPDHVTHPLKPRVGKPLESHPALDDQFIYLDNHSTTRCDPRVVSAMLPLLSDEFGNPHSSSHAMGRRAAELMDSAIDQIARCLAVDASEIVVTSGATESTNLAILGQCLHPRNQRRHLITSQIEHPAVLDPLTQLERDGFRVTRLPVSANGEIELDQLKAACTDETAIVSIMLANNEIGAIERLAEIAEIAHQCGAVVHTDATQAVGRISVDLNELPVDLLSASAHKFYGPKGVGFLFARRSGRRIRLRPLVHGGGQQRNLRPGTMNPAAICGMAAALQIFRDEMQSDTERIRGLRDRLFVGLQERIPGLGLNGPELEPAGRLAGNLNVMFPGVEGESLMALCPQIAVSSGSACSSVDPKPSHVLLGIGLSENEARSSLRFGIGRFNTTEDIDRAVTCFSDAYLHLVALNG